MNKMKKWIMLVSVCILCFCLVACGQKEEQKEDATQLNTEQNSKTELSDKQTDEDISNTEQEESGEKNGDYVLARPSQNGALSVKGTQLVDEQGQAVQLRGISTHGIAWFPDLVNQDAVNQLGSEFGANLFRIAMYTDENGGYCTDGDKAKLKQLVLDGVAYAKQADMYVIVDWHILHDNNPLTHKDEALQFFEEMTEQLKNEKHVIYEICNEPNGDANWEDIKAYAGEVLPVIRKNAPDAVVLIGTPTWSQEIDKPQNDPITGYDNIMYTLHFYAATHKQDLRDRMVSAIEAGTPVFVSEFGLCDASGNGGNDLTEAQNWIDTMDQYGVSYAVWSLCNKDETSALISSDCRKTSGFTKDDLSESGKWIYGMLHADRKAGTTQGKEQAGTTANADPNRADANKENGTQKTTSGNAGTGAKNISAGDLEVKATVTGSWESDGKTFYQYQLTITNKGTEDISSWEIPLTFSGDVELSDGWNGEYQADGNKLTIRSKDYNGEIQSGKAVEDIGFIISASSRLSLK